MQVKKGSSVQTKLFKWLVSSEIEKFIPVFA